MRRCYRCPGPVARPMQRRTVATSAPRADPSLNLETREVGGRSPCCCLQGTRRSRCPTGRAGSWPGVGEAALPAPAVQRRWHPCAFDMPMRNDMPAACMRINGRRVRRNCQPVLLSVPNERIRWPGVDLSWTRSSRPPDRTSSAVPCRKLQRDRRRPARRVRVARAARPRTRPQALPRPWPSEPYRLQCFGRRHWSPAPTAADSRAAMAPRDGMPRRGRRQPAHHAPPRRPP